ncbi:MAG: hypothetical protein ACXVJT_10990 [Thermoanaerobaculia bacterium]
MSARSLASFAFFAVFLVASTGRRNENGHRSVYISGSSPGFKAQFERFIDDDVAVIVLSNVYIASPSQIARDIRTILWSDKKQ